MNTYGRSFGRNGNYSKNDQITGRELMTPDEVRMLDNQFALLFIRGERPVKDLKFDLLKHPNIGLTSDGDAEPYIHGDAKDARFTIALTGSLEEEASAEDMAEAEKLAEGYELLSEEDIAEEYK